VGDENKCFLLYLFFIFILFFIRFIFKKRLAWEIRKEKEKLGSKIIFFFIFYFTNF